MCPVPTLPSTSAAVYLRIASAASLIEGMTPAALRKKILRSTVPPGVIRRWGRSILIHREKFLAWIESDGKSPAGAGRGT